MHPDPGRTHLPGAFDCRSQKHAAESLAGELRQQAKIDDLHIGAELRLQLKVAGRRARREADPGFQLGTIQVR